MPASTKQQIDKAIRARKAGLDFPIPSLEITLKVKSPKVAKTLELRRKDSDKEYTFETLIDIMIEAISICTGRSIEDAELFFVETGYESSELGRECLRLCGCFMSLRVLVNARERTSADEPDNEKQEVFT